MAQRIDAPPSLKRLLRALFSPQAYERIRFHAYGLLKRNRGYDTSYYEGIESANAVHYPLLAKTLFEEFRPGMLVDIGCGSGGISMAFKACGVREVFAFDGSTDSVAFAARRGVDHVAHLDLCRAESIPARGDLCICLEVAEHIPPEHADRLCRLLSGPAPLLVFTAAPPGQGGHLHLNMQPRSYWIEKYAALGMGYDEAAVARIRSAFGGRMLSDYDENLMVFRRS